MALVLIVDDSPTDVHVMQKALEQSKREILQLQVLLTGSLTVM